MNVNTASYFAKQRNNIIQLRLKAGKFAAFSALDVFAAGVTKSYDFSDIKADSNDGISVGHIINEGGATINITFDLTKGSTSNSPEIELKALEKFDIGQFHGLVYGMEIENISPTDFTLIEIFGV